MRGLRLDSEHKPRGYGAGSAGWQSRSANDILLCSESRGEVEDDLERWRHAMGRRGMKVSRRKPEYLCINEKEGDDRVRMQGEEIKKVNEFKCLGSTPDCEGSKNAEVKRRKGGRVEWVEKYDGSFV
ncbi:uncharacterized protein LOC125028614 [Penaeus chinensis]|uniref:uncharacterized protein LOC125028614 n=1 Tax=Penaeus chinensis TaxID=139456 RepID=UPI001FB6084D|nr:uncharacterized protein LOC125028614 [Penaeus chinensis]